MIRMRVYGMPDSANTAKFTMINSVVKRTHS